MQNDTQFRFILYIGGGTLNIIKEIVSTNLGENIFGVGEEGNVIREGNTGI